MTQAAPSRRGNRRWQVPGNRNDTIVYRTSGIDQRLAGRPVVADGGYRGNPEVIIPYQKPSDGSELPAWKEDLNAQPRTVRAQVVHALARSNAPR